MSLLDRERVKLLTLQQIVAPELARFEAELGALMGGGSPLVREICHHLQQGRSKRFRPTLLLLAAKDEGPVDARAVTAAACVELVHTATLVHDDFIDGAVTRRGLPSVNRAWGEAAALIMGDYLYARALDALCARGLEDAVRILAHTTLLMSEAEMLQLESKFSLDLDESLYLRIIEYKTAALIEAACEIGASFNPRGNGHRAIFGRFGRKVGLVFQITDDIFDYLGDERRLGKPTGQDWEEGRVTLPLIAALRQAQPAARDAFVGEARERRDGDWKGMWPRVKAFVAEHGGVDYAFAVARRFGDEAKAELEPVASGVQKKLLASAAEYVINRLN
jgi:octaprenyl-diphosphate synthase